MKRKFFCCLRGGSCLIDVNSRKKCNFCRFESLKIVTYFDFNFSRRFEKCREVGMSRNAEKKKVVSASNLLRKIESNNSKDNEKVGNLNIKRVQTYQFCLDSCSSLLLTFTNEEYVKIRNLKKLWNIQCEINPISVDLIYPLIDLAVRCHGTDSQIVHQHTRVGETYN